jgi:hypothetical protein
MNKLQTVYIPINGESKLAVVVYENGEHVEQVIEKEVYIFTPEELKQLLEEYTNRIVENAEVHTEFFDEESNPIYQVNRQSILSQLPLMLKKLGI